MFDGDDSSQIRNLNLPRNWRLWAIIFGGWTLFACLFSLQAIIYSAYFAKTVEHWKILLNWFSCAYIWALLTPAVIRLARRFPLEKGFVGRNLAIHLSASLLICVFQLAIYVFVRNLLPLGFAESMGFWRAFQNLLITTSHENLLLYWAVVGLAQAAEYYRRFRERERRAAQLEIAAAQLESQLAQAQLDALKMQLQPHFLFNTLNTISVLMREDIDAANRTLIRLSELLRLTLKNTGTHEVALRQELEFLRSYLEIEQTRFQDRLKINIKTDAETLDARVPNLILQPLVENAIRHAVAPRAAQSCIEISSERCNGYLKLSVRDDGAGIGATKTASNGIGLANTHARLEKLYGSAQSLEISSPENGGFEISITIPFRDSGNKDE